MSGPFERWQAASSAQASSHASRLARLFPLFRGGGGGIDASSQEGLVREHVEGSEEAASPNARAADVSFAGAGAGGGGGGGVQVDAESARQVGEAWTVACEHMWLDEMLEEVMQPYVSHHGVVRNEGVRERELALVMQYYEKDEAMWEALRVLQVHGLAGAFVDELMLALTKVVREGELPVFWERMETFPKRLRLLRKKNRQKKHEKLQQWVVENITMAVNYAHAVTQCLRSAYGRFGEELGCREEVLDRFDVHMHALFFDDGEAERVDLPQMLWFFFMTNFGAFQALQVLDAKEQEEEDGDEDEDDDDDDEEEPELDPTTAYMMKMDQKTLQERVAAFQLTCSKMQDMQWLGYAEQMYTEVCFAAIERRIETRCAGEFEVENCFERYVSSWLESTVFAWLELLLCPVAHMDGAEIVFGSPGFRDRVSSRVSSAASTPPLQRKQTRFQLAPTSPSESFLQWKHRMLFFAYERFGSLRIREMFDIIVDFPDSSPALEDLATVLKKTKQTSELITSLRAVFQKRLLHPGANTSDILTQYISTIRALRIIDRQGVVLEAVARPISEYLRERHDTVRCVVMSMTAGDTELQEELEQAVAGGSGGGDSSQHTGNLSDSDSDDDDGGHSDAAALLERERQWEPAPIESTALDVLESRHLSQRRRRADLITRLVNIFPSHEVFVNEYRSLLASKLLAKRDYDADKELAQLELLKLRFGASSMHFCEVILKDFEDSRRLDAHIHSRMRGEAVDAGDASGGGSAASSASGVKLGKQEADEDDEDDEEEEAKQEEATPARCAVDIDASALDAVIISSEFWPSLESLESSESMFAQGGDGDVNRLLPGPVAKLTKQYRDEYAELKKPRDLTWRPGLGLVTMEIQFADGRVREVETTPVHASLLARFATDDDEEDDDDDEDSEWETRPRWRLNELADATGLNALALRTRMNFWVSSGVIREHVDTSTQTIEYEVIEVLSAEDEVAMAEFGHAHDNGASSADWRSRSRGAAYAAQCEHYVLGILADFRGMTLSRIHTMLGMMSGDDFTFSMNEDELGEFLSRMVDANKLRFQDGLYRKVKAQAE